MLRSLVVLALVASTLGQRWEQERRSLASIAMGIAQGDARRVYTGGTWSGRGSAIMWSDNNGDTYSQRALESGPFIYSAAAAQGLQAIQAGHTAGILSGVQVTSDGGTTWTPWGELMEFPISTTQSCELVPNRQNERFPWFGCVGTFPGGQDGMMRVIFSEDAGATFQRTGTIGRRIRYGSYPTRNTWYLTGGTWPGLPDVQEEGIVELGWGLRIETKKDASNGNATHSRVHYTLGADAHVQADPKDFTAVVWKTTNRGATWTRVFDRPSQGFYPQYISCPTERQCWMAAEGSVGALVFHTNDGGMTWTQQLALLNDPQTRYHFYPIVMLNERDGWVAGAKSVFPTMDGVIYRTSDGGRTWVEQPAVPGMMINSMNIKEIPGGLAGHGLMVSWPEQQSGSIVLRN